MAQDSGSAWLVLLVAGIAVVGLALSASTFYTHNTFSQMMGGGGGMMDGNPSASGTGPGSFEWTILIVSAALFVGALLLWYRSRSSDLSGSARQAAAPPAIAPAVSAPGILASAQAQPPGAPVDELTLVKLLDADERRMYLELREHGGSMLQRDIVGLGIFSKAKVTRVLDKLEAKGLVRREAHGMTNRVRLVSPASK
ncbi:MAG TPA: hypothetical protein VI999_03930 [Thermoplasmata archaeon]|nr:hypothetical protein [Thermoplasmata archaeon]